MIKKLFSILKLITIILILNIPTNINAEAKNLVNIYFFHSNDCSHCNSELIFLDTLEKKYDNIKIYKYEVHDNTNNQKRLEISKLYNLKNSGVPLTIIGDTAYLGYLEEISNLNFIKTIEYYSIYGYEDRVGKYLNIDYSKNLLIEDSIPTLDEFKETYGNYHLTKNIHTNDYNITTNGTILGLFTGINPLQLLILLLILLITKKRKINQTIIAISTHLSLSFILLTITTIIPLLNNKIAIILLLITLLLIGILIYKTIKRKKYLYIKYLSISLLSNIIYLTFFSKYLKIFKELLNLHLPTKLTLINYYSNYLLTILMIYSIYIIIIIFLKLNIKTIKLKQYKN